MSVGRFRSVLTSLGLEPTPRELAEILWLAAQLPPGAAPAAAPGDTRQPPEHRTGAPPGPETEDGAAPEAPPRVPVHTATVPGTAPAPDAPAGRPVRLPVGSPVPELPLLRTLRPLKRLVPSRAFSELDEEATAERGARHFAARGRGGLVPVVRPTPERWLDVVLVVDSHETSRMLWASLTDDVYRLLVRSGAFRQVRVRYLHLGPDGPLGVSTEPGTGAGPLRGTSELRDPSGRRLVLVLTDAVAPGWGHPRVHEAVRQWAAVGPVAVLQALPERLWPQTALPTVLATLRRPERSAANTDLVYTGHRRRTRVLPPGSTPVPVLELAPRWFAPWARLVAGAGDGGADAAVLLLGEAVRAGRAPDFRPPGQRLRDFQAVATPEAFRLLTCLAAVPLTVSVMRVVQAAMLPGSAPSLLAEVLFSGLLVPSGPDRDGPVEERPYDFLPGLRAELLAGLRAHEVDTVLRETSGLLERSAAGAPGRVTGLVPDVRGHAGLPEDGLPWARLRADALARAGLPGPAEPRGPSRPRPAHRPDPSAPASPSAPAGPSGRRLFGPYRLGRYLTSADFSEVFLGLDDHGRDAAVKIPPTDSDIRQLELFRELVETEAEALRRMAGTYAPRLLGAGPRADEPWLAMELVRSVSGHAALNLNHRPWAENGRPDDPVALLYLVRRLAEALDRAHSRGIVHGNLSPHAVLLVPDSVVLISWMYAQHDGLPHPYARYRPPRERFLPPEGYSRRRPLDASFDIYGLGAIVAHELPRRRRTPPGDAVPGPGDPELRRVLGRLLDRCMAEQPDLRPTAVELLEEIGSLGLGTERRGPVREDEGTGRPGRAGQPPEADRERRVPWAVPQGSHAPAQGIFDSPAARTEAALDHWNAGRRAVAITLLQALVADLSRERGPDHPAARTAADLLRSWREQERKPWWRRWLPGG
ncbi:hypothetical protein J7I94_04065 [Streptomyces sp. ISL-12]|uniref:SAV_2336 N-terminal domain-related protein n=1 Tax=Streptomyces sp. ISL-12 TaxID=2819177 RepID=UPI001BEA7059|nr:SAV_2336 N-terminal domain-related protein [Streptomyces sp. ISL-12]MBT2409738.1 hypothetical protein [Streptomyces sp. ISL-12]